MSSHLRWGINVTENAQFHAAGPHCKAGKGFLSSLSSPDCHRHCSQPSRGAQQCQSVWISLGQGGGSSPAPLGCAAPAFSQICRAMPGPAARWGSGGKLPAGSCCSYFAKSGELKVTLKMEGNRSVTSRLLMRFLPYNLTSHGLPQTQGDFPAGAVGQPLAGKPPEPQLNTSSKSHPD